MTKLSFISDTEIQELEKMEIQYLFSYFFRFFTKNKIELKQKIILDEKLLTFFKSYLEEGLMHLLTDCYTEPNLKTVQKHPTRYEKIIFQGKKYKVDYTTSNAGRLIYTLFLRVSFINKIISSKGKLTLLIE